LEEILNKYLGPILKILGGIIVSLLVIVFCFLYFKNLQSEKNLQHPEFYRENFVLIYKWEMIPPEVRDEINNELSKRELDFFKLNHVQFRMADPEEPFNDTDVNENPKLPFFRLIFAGVSANSSFIYYQTGGLEQATRLIVIKKVGTKYEYDWSVWVPRKIRQFYNLKFMMKNWPEHFPPLTKGQI
jgi:hypothetical protein